MIKSFEKQEPLERIFTALNGSGYALLEADKDLEKYSDYVLGRTKDFTEQDFLNMEVLQLLLKLGFSINELGTYLYKDLIIETYKRLDNNENNQLMLKNDLKDAFSSLYLYIAREWKEIGIKSFQSYIERAVQNIDYDKADKELAESLFVGEESDYGSQAYVIALYKAGKLNKKNKDYSKPYIKRLPNMPEEDD